MKLPGRIGMTAMIVLIAVPAVLAYNWLVRRNKSIMEDLAAFTNDLNGFIASGGKVKPRFATGGTAKAGTADAGRGATTTAGSPSARTQEPLRTGAITGVEATRMRSTCGSSKVLFQRKVTSGSHHGV